MLLFTVTMQDLGRGFCRLESQTRAYFRIWLLALEEMTSGDSYIPIL